MKNILFKKLHNNNIAFVDSLVNMWMVILDLKLVHELVFSCELKQRSFKLPTSLNGHDFIIDPRNHLSYLLLQTTLSAQNKLSINFYQLLYTN